MTLSICHYAECHDLFIVLLNVIMLNVIMLNVEAPSEVFERRIIVTIYSTVSKLTVSQLTEKKTLIYDFHQNSLMNCHIFH